MGAVVTSCQLVTIPRAGHDFRVQVSQNRQKVIHSSQVYDKKDYRKNWVVGYQREVSESVATTLITK